MDFMDYLLCVYASKYLLILGSFSAKEFISYLDRFLPTVQKDNCRSNIRL
jgi:hypothetical protein